MDQPPSLDKPAESRVSRPAGGARRFTAPLLLAALLLATWQAAARTDGSTATHPAILQDVQHLDELLQRLCAFAADQFVLFARYVPLGFLVPLCAPAALNRRSGTTRRVLVFAAGAGVAASAWAIETGGLPGWPDFALPLAGCFLGSAAGMRWIRGGKARAWLIPQLMMLALLIMSGTAGLFWLATDAEPFDFDPPEITSAEKSRVMDQLRNGIPVPGREHLISLRVETRDVDSILNWGLPLVATEAKTQTRIEEGVVRSRLSIRLPVPCPRYLNAQTACSPCVESGRLSPRVRELRLGRIALPRWLLSALSSHVERVLAADSEMRQGMAAVASIEILPDAIEITRERGEFSAIVLPSLIARLTEEDDVLQTTRLYHRHLIEFAERELPRRGQRLESYLQEAFALARERSRSRDPVAENRAALFAIAILQGDRRVEGLVGPVTSAELREETRESVRRGALRGRKDWTRHFCISAAVALRSGERVSDAVGLLKEELDAGRGGSGFSFADLMADRAGTLFALSATRDAAAATAMQQRLAEGFDSEDIFPPAEDLPEGLSEEQLRAEYGGIGGPEYRTVLRDIEERLARCSALR